VVNTVVMFGATVAIGGQFGLELMYFMVLHLFLTIIFASVSFALLTVVCQSLGMLAIGLTVESISLNQIITGPLAFYLVVMFFLGFYFYYYRRKEAHYLQRIEASEARYRAIVEDQIEMICRVRADERLTITFANKMYMETFGITPDQIGRVGLRDVIIGAPFDTVRARFQQLTPEAPDHSGTEHVILPDGSERWQSWNDRGLFDEQGRLIEAQNVGRDITELKRAEEQAAELAREQERVLALQVLIGDVSHDLMTPLTVIGSNLHLIGKVEDRDRQELYVDRAQEQVHRLQRMIKDMVNMSRLDRETEQGLELTEVPLHEFLEDLVRTHQSVARLKHQALVLGAGIPEVSIRVDENRMQVALSNLVDNALKYSPENGRVRVSAQCYDGIVRIRVADNGGGIPPQDMPHIFDRFYRGAAHRPANSGTGLGLPITRKIVELHGGQIEVQSIPTQGAIFTIKLPAAEPQIPA
ncbi:MAG: PAS domain S-box protein, partial [Anaerolineae bacterium]|nr:PAS domain S-box protein [Anaerolineae bacterium]